jgi:hypothetical protein
MEQPTDLAIGWSLTSCLHHVISLCRVVVLHALSSSIGRAHVSRCSHSTRPMQVTV